MPAGVRRQAEARSNWVEWLRYVIRMINAIANYCFRFIISLLILAHSLNHGAEHRPPVLVPVRAYVQHHERARHRDGPHPALARRHAHSRLPRWQILQDAVLLQGAAHHGQGAADVRTIFN